MNENYDQINPEHYRRYSTEVIDMMVAIWGKESVAEFCEMCAFKYRMRAGNKPDTTIGVDLNKELWYLKKRDELLNAEKYEV